MPVASKSQQYRKLPSVHELVRTDTVARLAAREGQATVTCAARRVLNNLRHQITAGQISPEALDRALSELAITVENDVRQSLKYSLLPVINATGVILHTNLGRAPLTRAALDHIQNTSGGYSNLEFDIDAAERGRRDEHVDRLFRRLLNNSSEESSFDASEQTAVSSIVVNNNAAAILLALNTLAEKGEVIVSRGELVEIGGSFRIPEIMAKSNAILREVGTTNRTSLADYDSAINQDTKLLLRVHRSNFEIMGFTTQPGLEELASLARERKIPLMHDLGSGSLFDLTSIGVHGEPGILDSLHAGVDVVAYSGDKLLGGPQAGIISGDHDLITRMRENSLFRALRACKLTYAALEATLLQYIKQDYDAIPALRMMRLSKQQIATRAEAIIDRVQSPAIKLELVDGESVIGGGAAPSATLPTCLLALTSKTLTSNQITSHLRKFVPPVITRVEEDRVLLDLRTVFPAQDEYIVEAINDIPVASEGDEIAGMRI